MLKWLRKLFSSKGETKDVSRLARIDEFSQKIGHQFRCRELLVQALKHRSFLPQVNERRTHSNERLELLGDAVLGLAVTEHLYKRFPEKDEGEITAAKSLLVSRKILSRIARQLDLGRHILMSESEEKSGGRERSSIIADAFEAVIGAIYLDAGLEEAHNFVEKFLLADMDNMLNEEQHRNFKSMLLELSQSRNLGIPNYNVLSEEGPDHNKLFTVEVQIQNNTLGVGVGNSKKRAEQKAAQEALIGLWNETD